VEFFTPGVDTNLYHPAPRDAKGPFRIVFYGRPNNNRNAFNLGIEALRQVKDYYGRRVDIVSVGGEWPEQVYGMRGIARNLGILSAMGEVAALYRSCDIGLVFMFSAHPSYQPLEFMASGCCTVTNFNPSTTWLLRDRENAFLTGATSASVARCIIEALDNPESRRQVVQGGLETARNLSWNTAFNRIADFVASPRPIESEFGSPFPEGPGITTVREGVG
jgi:glycosyltransferase involved in cell wall biosynthesis